MLSSYKWLELGDQQYHNEEDDTQCSVNIATSATQEAFEKCWAHLPLRAAAILPFTRCRRRRNVARGVAHRLHIDIHNDGNNNDDSA